jgi:[protein-PII] uridylyltransferase
MATKPFLKDDDLLAASEKLSAPSHAPTGDETRKLPGPEFSRELQSRLLARLSSHPSWSKSGPIALGSWSRDELSPKSDIDLLFTGDEGEVLKLVTDFAKHGLKLRYRMPENLSDWTIGVEPFDLLALIGARTLGPSSMSAAASTPALELVEQQARAFAKRREILKAMVQERRTRTDRYDSITNYLEPNLKYGSGGLRDLEQALSLKVLFPEKFTGPDDEHAFEVLSYYKRFFLLVRQKLHLAEGAGDLLTAPEQAPIAKWLGYKSPRDFMKEIQRGVSRVSFYADWAFEVATASRNRLAEVESQKLSSPADLFKALRKDSSVLMQNRVRNHADRVFASRGLRKELGTKKALDRLIGRELTSFIDPSKPEAPLIALFRSRLIDHCVPEFRKIVGHVQHDQYHRFSVDAHILQALRELGRLRKKPKLAGKLERKLSKQEWEILAFTCLYHDIAKGREGDHSVEGIAIAEHDLKAFGKTAAFIKEVAWIVEEHLILSSAAFKENPASPTTWARLSGKRVEKRRIPLLSTFTIVDIRATNPEAWTPWKERLLNEVVSNLENPSSSSAIQLAKLKPDWVERLDSFLVSMVPAVKISQDLEETLAHREVDSAPKILKTKGGQTWIRFHSAEDKPGLFANYVGALSAAGLSVRHASIHTFKETGVYDWFEVKTEKSVPAIAKLLTLALAKRETATATATSNVKRPVHFDSISLVSQTSDEWIISFRGKDQPGALLQAATALAKAGGEIQWARVHTWGRQIDDVFGIKPPSSDNFLERLKDSSG